jgi:hypothetical protein
LDYQEELTWVATRDNSGSEPDFVPVQNIDRLLRREDVSTIPLVHFNACFSARMCQRFIQANKARMAIGIDDNRSIRSSAEHMAQAVFTSIRNDQILVHETVASIRAKRLPHSWVSEIPDQRDRLRFLPVGVSAEELAVRDRSLPRPVNDRSQADID